MSLPNIIIVGEGTVPGVSLSWPRFVSVSHAAVAWSDVAKESENIAGDIKKIPENYDIWFKPGLRTW